ncbi:MAG: hypothetical protein EOL97_12910 [Spirochaetia bacterium]|nr:hypothetical protein [Spirochaetia bacterium]
MSEVTVNEYNTTSSSVVVATNLNFGSINQANLNVSLYPVVAGTSSYEKWIKILFGGVFTSISNIKIYKTSGDYVTGETLKYSGGVTSWTMPTNNASSVATTPIPTSEPVSSNVKVGGVLGETITVSGTTTDFIVLQASFSNNTSAGMVNRKAITISWDEV